MPKLDRRHVAVAADLLALVPKTEIARKHGVSVQTLGRWIDSPQFQALYSDLEARLAASRASAFAPLLVDVCAMLREVANGHARRVREKGVADYQTPSLPQIEKLLVTLAKLQRLSHADALLAGRSIAGGHAPKRPKTTAAAQPTPTAPEITPEAEAEAAWDLIERAVRKET